ncbi:MAG: DUF2807 domain-containing protein [Raineya sp.]|jgi:hypothetical protein|nr:DUF2807 domain-containing protein [Raineya sp.]
MKKNHWISFCLVLLMVVSACQRREDYGPIQESEMSIGLQNFQKLEMGDAFVIEVIQGSEFSIVAKGDKRNLDDLEYWVSNQTLKVQYKNSRNRQYSTRLYITMPSLQEINFSGASKSTIKGFTGNTDFKLNLSGASTCDLQVQASNFTFYISGASRLKILENLNTNKIEAYISGASTLNGFLAKADIYTLDVSGASKAEISANQTLRVKASGASYVRYKGSPTIESNLSGESHLQQD